jgi:hypothetical protein
MNLDVADALPPGLLCAQCDKPIYLGPVLRDPRRPWLVVHRECASEFVPDPLELIHRDAIQVLLEAEGEHGRFQMLQRIVAVQAAHADLMRQLVDRSAAIEITLNVAREKWTAPRTDLD